MHSGEELVEKQHSMTSPTRGFSSHPSWAVCCIAECWCRAGGSQLCAELPPPCLQLLTPLPPQALCCHHSLVDLLQHLWSLLSLPPVLQEGKKVTRGHAWSL